jgi:hypothetical protein
MDNLRISLRESVLYSIQYYTKNSTQENIRNSMYRHINRLVGVTGINMIRTEAEHGLTIS